MAWLCRLIEAEVVGADPGLTVDAILGATQETVQEHGKSRVFRESPALVGGAPARLVGYAIEGGPSSFPLEGIRFEFAAAQVAWVTGGRGLVVTLYGPTLTAGDWDRLLRFAETFSVEPLPGS